MKQPLEKLVLHLSQLRQASLLWMLPISIFIMFLLSGCTVIISSATQSLAENLSLAIINNDDPDTVREGTPAYLIMIDSFIEGDPENAQLLYSASKLNTAYAALFVSEPERLMRMTEKSLRLADRALCIEFNKYCSLPALKFQAFTDRLANVTKQEVAGLHALGTTWSGWLEAHSGDWNAVAQIPQVKHMLNVLLEVDETYDQGSSHYYLALLNCILPPSLGGKSELARKHFERAIELSDGSNLMAKVSFAEKYARLVFDQELHDRLLTEVIEADPHIKGYVLVNQLAQARAKELLSGSSDYF